MKPTGPTQARRLASKAEHERRLTELAAAFVRLFAKKAKQP